MEALNKKTVEDLDVNGKKVLVRCDFNVPLKDGVITSDKRIVASLPTIKYLIDHNAKVILCSHLGRPKGEFNPEFSLAPVAARLSELLGKEVVLSKAQQDALTAVNQQPAQIVLGVRPVNLSVAQEGFAATIDVSEMMGSEMHLHMSVGDKDVVAVIPTAGLDLDAVRSGNGVKFTFDPALAHLFDPETGLNLL